MSYKDQEKYKSQIKYELTHKKTILKNEVYNKIDKLQKNRESVGDLIEMLYEFYIENKDVVKKDLKYEVK